MDKPVCCGQPMTSYTKWKQVRDYYRRDEVAVVARRFFACACGREVDQVGENLVEREGEEHEAQFAQE